MLAMTLAPLVLCWDDRRASLSTCSGRHCLALGSFGPSLIQRLDYLGMRLASAELEVGPVIEP